MSYSVLLFVGGINIWLLGVLSACFRGMGLMQFPAALMVLGAAVQVPLSGALVLGWIRTAPAGCCRRRDISCGCKRLRLRCNDLSAGKR